MGQVAASMAGQHYVKGAKGARPGKQDGAPPRRGNVTLLRTTDPDSPAFLAAGSPLGDLVYVCGGRYETIGQTPLSGNSQSLKRYLSGQDPSNAGRCYTAAGLTPRRVLESADEKKARPLVWGECCDGWRHFDCLGLIDFALAQASAKEEKELRYVEQWASPKNSVKASKMPEDEEFWMATLFPW